MCRTLNLGHVFAHLPGPGSIKQPSLRSAGAFHVPKPLQPNISPPESSGASSWWYHPVAYNNKCAPGLSTHMAEYEHRIRPISNQWYNRSIGLIFIPVQLGLQLPQLGWNICLQDWKWSHLPSSKTNHTGDCVAFGNDDVLLLCLIYPDVVEI